MQYSKKQEFDKYKAFYTYVFMQHREIVRSSEARQLDGRQNEEIAYINDFALSLLEY